MNEKISFGEISSCLSTAFGLEFDFDPSPAPGVCKIRPRGMSRPHGVRIVLRESLSRIVSFIEFDSLALNVRNEFERNWSEEAVAERLRLLREKYLLLGVNADESFKLSDDQRAICIGYFHFEKESTTADYVILAEFTVSTLLSALKLVDDLDSDEEQMLNLDEEGKSLLILSTKYERSRRNRSFALAIHGYKCFACGIDFENFYGPIGRGFIEVHHLVPVSMMQEPRIVDPRTELVPLCSNCHRMAHRKWPPFSPDELRAFIVRNREN